MVYREGATKGALLLAVSRKNISVTAVLQAFQQTLENNNEKKKETLRLMFQQTLEVHIIALNFYETWLCHIFMDKCNDGRP